MQSDGEAIKSASQTTLCSRQPGAAVSDFEIRVNGKTVLVPSVQIEGRTIITSGKLLKIATVHDEELFEGGPIADPEQFVSHLMRSGLKPDMFAFSPNLPDVKPKFSYHIEWENLAVVPIRTFSHWWSKAVEPSIRRAVRKAAKSGVVVKEVELDDAFVKGIVEINNETPVRQGRTFWHYQKAFGDVKHEHLTYPDRTTFLGAYYNDELIGYMRLIYAGSVAHVSQLLSRMKHFDKRPTNALIAKAVEVCDQRGISQLVYCNYVYHDPKSSLTVFKRRNAFEKVLVPRYYVPLTLKGRIALLLGLHRRLVDRLPEPLVTRLLAARSSWYNSRVLKATVSSAE